MVTRVWLADFGLENDQPWCSFRVTIKWRPERKCKSFYPSMTRENEPESYCLCFSSQVAVSQLLPHRRQSCPWPQSSNLSTRAPNPQIGHYYSHTKRPCVVSLSSRRIQLVGLLQLANDLCSGTIRKRANRLPPSVSKALFGASFGPTIVIERVGANPR
ncbi:hypothetical protein CC79DRAFT_199013 [Sarocladium strictum]